MYEQSQDSNYEIEQVLNDKIIDGKLYYFVKWKGYPHSQNSWEPQEHLVNALEHVQVWKERKNKLRKLDKVSKRKKSEQSFDGKKYVQKNRAPGPMTSSDSKKTDKLCRKSLRIKQKDDTAQGRLSKDFDSSQTSQTQQSKTSIKSTCQETKNPLFQVLSSIQKINKQKKLKQKQQSISKRKSFLEGLKSPSSDQLQNPAKKKRGRKPKNTKDTITQKPEQTIDKKKQSLNKNSNQQSLNKQTAHKNEQPLKVNKRPKKIQQQQQSQNQQPAADMQKDGKPQIYNEILHYLNDNNQYQRSKYHQMNNFNKNGNKNSNKNGNKNENNKNNMKKSRKNSMAELSSGYQKNKDFAGQLNVSKQFNMGIRQEQKNDKKIFEQQQKKQQEQKNPPSWLNSAFGNIFQSKNFLNNNHQIKNSSKLFDQLQQISLSNSKRLPNFIDRYGLASTGYKDGSSKNGIYENKIMGQAANKTNSIQLANTTSDPNHPYLISHPSYMHSQIPYKNVTNIPPSNNRLYKSQVSPSLFRNQNNEAIEIQSSSGRSNFNDTDIDNDNDESLIMIPEQDYKKNVKGSKPGKRIFLNEEYDQVSVDAKYQEKQRKEQPLSKLNGFVNNDVNFALRKQKKADPPCDPRLMHRAKVAGHQLHQFLFKNPSIKRFELSPQEYLRSLIEKTRNQIKKNGVCLDLEELEKRESQRDWSVGEADDQRDDEQVWVLEDGQFEINNYLKKSNKIENVRTINISSSKNHLKTPTEQKKSPIKDNSLFYQSSSSLTQSQTASHTNPSTKPSQQQQLSDDMQLLEGIQEDILDLFTQRYPSQPITKEIKEQISKIVRKIAYENMEMEVGLGLIDEWMESCEMKAKRSEKICNGMRSEVRVQENQLVRKNVDNEGNKLLSNQEIPTASRESEQGEMILTQDQASQADSKKTHSSLPKQIQTTKPQPQSKPSLIPKPTQTIQQSNIIKIISQFQYKNQRCFKLLLKNNKQVNVHYLQLKKNCPKVLFDYLEVKCQQFQRQYMGKNAGNNGKISC